MRIGILGASFGTNNLGVNALAEGAVICLNVGFPDAEVFFLDYGKEPDTYFFDHILENKEVRLKNIRFSKKLFLPNNIALLLSLAFLIRVVPAPKLIAFIRRKNHLLNHLLDTDLFLAVSGGDSFSDIYGVMRYIYVALPIIFLTILKMPVIFLPQTIGPFKRSFVKRISKVLMNRAVIVYSRDTPSQKLVQIMLNDTIKARFSYDLGFLLPAEEPASDVTIIPAPISESKTLIGLNVNGLLFKGGYTKDNMFSMKTDYPELMQALIMDIFRSTDANILLIPHVRGGTHNFESDEYACSQIYKIISNSFPKRIFLVTGNFNHRSIKHFIGRCDFFIGSRLHSCIAALSQCVPAVAISYSRKFTGVYSSIGLEECVVDPRHLNGDTVSDKILSLFGERHKIKHTLNSIMPTVINQTLNILKDLEIPY